MAILLNFKKIQKRLIVIISLFAAIFFEIILLYIDFTDTSLIGTFTGELQVKFTLFFAIYILIILAILEIFGLLLVKGSLRSENPEIKLKGKFLLIGFLSVVFGTVAEAAIPITIVIVIGRIVLVLSSIMLYIGFTLPDLIKKIFLKKS